MNPTPEQLNEIKRLLEEINRLYKRYNEEPLDLDLSSIKDADKQIEALNIRLKTIRNRAEDFSDSFQSLAASLQSNVQALSSSNNAVLKVVRSTNSLVGIAEKLREEEQGRLELSEKELENLQKRAIERTATLETAKEELKNQQELKQQEISNLETKVSLNLATADQVKSLQKLKKELTSINEKYEFASDQLSDQASNVNTLNSQIERRLKLEKEINSQMGVSGGILKTLSKTFEKAGFGSFDDIFNDTTKKQRSIAEESIKNRKKIVEDGGGILSQFGNKAKSSIGIFTEGLKGIGKVATRVFSSITVIATKVFQEILSILKDIDEQAGKIAKQFNITYQEAVALRSELAQAAIATEDIFVNSQSLQKSLSTINQITGTRVLSGLGSNLQQNVVFLTQLAERAGLAEDAIARIAQVSFSTGVSAEDLVSTLTAQVELRNLNEDQLFNEKAIFDEISKLSSATLLSLSQYPTQISDAFFDAKLLGLELSKVDNIAAGFTDFGTSIRTELEAIVVTGKQLNLNAARFYALNNDTAGVAREISKQIGTSAEFANMNRIAQESLAKAFNMSRDEVADILLIQDQLLGLSEREATAREKELTALRATVGEQRFRQAIEEKNVDRLLEQVSITDRFRASIARIKDALIPLLTPLTSIVNSLAYVLEGIPKALSGIKSFGEGVGTFFGNVVDSFKELFRQISEGIEAFQNNTIVKGLSNLFFGTGSIQEDINREIESENAKEVASSGIRMTNPAISRQLQSGTTIPVASSQRGVVSPVINNESLQTVSNETMSSVSSQNVINTTQANVDTSELVAAMKKSNELIEQQTKVLAQGQEAIRTQKQNLVVGATSLGTQINTNSYRVQFG